MTYIINISLSLSLSIRPKYLSLAADQTTTRVSTELLLVGFASQPTLARSCEGVYMKTSLMILS